MKTLRAFVVVLLSSMTLSAQQQPIPPTVGLELLVDLDAIKAKIVAAMSPVVNCKLSDPVIDSGEWLPTSCPTSCTQTRIETTTRTIEEQPANGGTACGPLVTTESFTRIPDPVNATYGPWTPVLPQPSFGTCMNGFESRILTETRQELTPQNFGGAVEDTTRTIPDTRPCTVIPTPPSVGHHFLTPWDKIPNFVESPTVVSVKSGTWSDTAVWSTGAVPGPADVVDIKATHHVVYDSMVGSVKTLGVSAGGKFSCSLTQSTQLLVGTLMVLPGGTLECGTSLTPLPANLKAEIVIRDLPLQTTPGTGVFDPSQYGNGVLVVDATIRLHGTPIGTNFVRLADEPLAGSRTLRVTTLPAEWKVGAVVVVPDTRLLVGADMAPKNANTDNTRRRQSWSETATIQSISGTTLTLTTPLAFDHKGARDPDGVLQLLPHVGLLTRNILIRSENPAGTRGHVLVTGTSQADIRYAFFKNLGRTTDQLVDSTTFDANGVVTKIGTNQIGRYPLHIHHVPGVCSAQAFQFSVVGNAIQDGRKWAMTVHGSSDGLIQDNVIFDATGAGIAGEDGSEVRNVFEHNFIVKVESSAKLSQHNETTENTDPFGRRGNGFWFQGAGNVVRNNVVADTREGYGYYVGSAENGPLSHIEPVNVPNFPCANNSIAGQFTSTQRRRIYNLEVSGNEAYSTSEFAFGTWFMEQPSTGRNPITRLTIWNFRNIAVQHKYWNGTFDFLRILNPGGTGMAILQDNFMRSGGQAQRSELHHADIQGVLYLFRKGGQLALAPRWIIDDSLLRSKNGWELNSAGETSPTGTYFTFTNVRFPALPGLPPVALNLVEVGGVNSFNTGPKRFEVFSHNGDPSVNFRAYYTSQAPPGKYGAVATCSTTRPEIPGAFVCP